MTDRSRQDEPIAMTARLPKRMLVLTLVTFAIARDVAVTTSDVTDVVVEGYGYPEKFGKEEFEKYVEKELGTRLKGDVYMDWAGSALYTTTQIENAMGDLKENLYGNPHSLSSSATRSTEAVEAAREDILRFLGAKSEDYEVIFTRSCTDSLRLVADTFPWSPGGEFRYLVKNHNSVLGIREVARARGATARAVSKDDVEKWLEDGDEPTEVSLFAYPGEENFAGEMFPLDWASRIVAAREKGSQWRVLIDAAKFLATHPLNLTRTPADFVTMSFYKLFGFPTGVGALVARKETANELTKCFFGGGTVSVAGAGRSEMDDVHVLKSRICERFEDGTVSFLGIAELRHGFAALDVVGGPHAIEQHTRALAGVLDDRLRSLRHSNDMPVVVVYGPDDRAENEGPVVNFNVLDKDGNLISHIDVMATAAQHGIHVRAGAECNPGAAYDYLGVPPDAVHQLAHDENYQGCGMGPAFITCKANNGASRVPNFLVSEVDFAFDETDSTSIFCDPAAKQALQFPGDDVQVPLGSVRASLGYLSTLHDVDTLVNFIHHTYRQS